MLIRKMILLLVAACILPELLFSQQLNLDMEDLKPDGSFAPWKVGFGEQQAKSYPVVADSTEKKSGKYALRMNQSDSLAQFGTVQMILPGGYEGSMIKYSAYLKSKDVKNWAGLWMRFDDNQGKTLAFDNMEKRSVKGTTDWNEYTITLPYSKNVASIYLGALLAGPGTIWFDKCSVLIDGQDIQQLKPASRKIYPADQDTAFKKGSGVHIQLTPGREKNLLVLGQLWGFLKYHHPAVAAGNYNWDAELMRLLPSVLAAKNKQECNMLLEKWVDALPKSDVREKAAPMPADMILRPDYGSLFEKNVLPLTLQKKLKGLLAGGGAAEHYYIGMMPGVGNPEIKNERVYADMKYPDDGYRLLALYRYWNLVNYFFPYRSLIDHNWNKVLEEMIPVFIHAGNETAYVLACIQLFGKVSDSHAVLLSRNDALEQWRGKLRAPFEVKFIEDKLVVTRFYTDTLNIQEQIKRGDVIQKIDGKDVGTIVKELLPYTPASNYPTQLREIARAILRGNKEYAELLVQRGTSILNIKVPRFPMEQWFGFKNILEDTGKKSYEIIRDHIGYIYPGTYKNSDLDAIKKAFADTRGMIIDMRCYPSEFMPFTFGSYIKPAPGNFVKFSKGNIQTPGAFYMIPPISNGSRNNDYYNRKIVIIVNETTQSQAEYTTMAFQSAPNITVIGSTTAGADGNVSPIYLPGNIYTWFSGIGVFYPDNTGTQRVGVKIDQVVKPTVEGVRQGRDELLEKAISILNAGK
ncbi:S41 family peptidase [Niabella sp.]|uniref:S41 family peptidase n=1 Tax=Niabella sp. TaxID=1962976 RepID=UPI002630DB45|nr:S41 family peptidase [Niabella sp.]